MPISVSMLLASLSRTSDLQQQAPRVLQ
jgi:hypothetical protein